MQRGSSKYGDDVIVGSSEYMKRWRAANKDKHKLAVEKYKARQKQLILAAKISKEDNITVEEALRNIRGELNNLATLQRNLIADGRIPARANERQPSVPAEPRIEFVQEMADKHNIDYEVAFDIMDKEANVEKWDGLMVEANHKKIADIIHAPVESSEEYFQKAR